MEGYCVRCKGKKEFINEHVVTLRNGRPAMKGNCPVCNTKMTRILPKSYQSDSNKDK